MSKEFLQQLMSDVFDVAHSDSEGSLRLTALTRVLVERFEEAGVLSSPVVAYLQPTGRNQAEVHAYACDTEDDVITVVYCIDATAETQLGVPPEVSSTPKDAIDKAYKRLEAFVKLAEEGKLTEIDESSEAHELIELIRAARHEGQEIVGLVVTTGTVSERAVHNPSRGNIRHDLWDLIRLERVLGGQRDGAIDIDFERDFARKLPCLVTPKSEDGVLVLLTGIPGDLLADIYNTHRSALLERNVRSFLQFAGKVNKGIRSTLMNEPGRFLAYNNGLSATAGAVELCEARDGTAQIRSVRGLQIVNGGQTTASIASCARRDKLDLSGVTVPMKLTVVPAELLDGLVPQISRYANTQNKIQDSDFSANDPWHTQIERLSRSVWTQPTEEAPRGSRWFYERSRGQYKDELAAAPTQAGKKKFRAENPPSQKLTKTDLAKFVLSWDQHPHMVSRGAQKGFKFFTDQLGSTARTTPAEADFQRIVAMAVIFRAAEDLYSEMGFQGFRAQVVTHSVARLSYDLQKRLDVDWMWKRQRVPDECIAALKYILTGVRDIILNPPRTQKNSTEWAKKPECWTAVLQAPISTGIQRPVVDDMPTRRPDPGILAAVTPEEQQLIAATISVPAEIWFSVAKWAKDTASLQVYQRKIAFSLGQLAGRGKPPSVKQSRQGLKLLLEAIRVGFSHPQLSEDITDGLRRVPESV